MKCGNPVLCRIDNGKKIYRNWNAASPLIRATAQLVHDCGKCLHCQKKRASELAMRCVLNASLYKKNMFLTLTYDESHPGYVNVMTYEDIQKFKKKLRAHCWRREKKRIECFHVHEYGKKGKKHWHAIVFNHDFDDKEIYTKKNGRNLYTSKKLEEMWSHGFVTIGDVTEASAMYQAQYMQKDYKNGNYNDDYKARSQHSGIGKSYFLKNYRQILRLGYIPFAGSRRPIPRYYRKIAHKHWCHYYDRSAFVDLIDRKRLYTRFNDGEANRDLADEYAAYIERRVDFIDKLEGDWEILRDDHLVTGEEPDFVGSLRNSYYDLKNKNTEEKF